MKLLFKYCVCSTALVFLFFFLKNRYSSLFVRDYSNTFNKNIKNSYNKSIINVREITLILRYNREYSKHIISTVNSFLFNFPFMPVIIVSDTVIPREILYFFSNKSNIINIPLKLDLLNFMGNRNVADYVKTNYIFVAPAGVYSFAKEERLILINILKKKQADIIAVPVKNKIVKCSKIGLNLMQWTIIYKISNNFSDCSSIQGEHGIFMHSRTLHKFAEPFLLPFPEAFYIQATGISLKTKLIQNVTVKQKGNYGKPDSAFKNQIQRQIMNKQFKIKKVIKEDGTVEWFGCTRSTSRCFQSIANSIPEYINQGRWTPPCCLKVLRETVHHVFKVLKKWNVTFWLEGGSLLGAVRMKDIIPWDYDVDVGMYLEDISKCPWLHTVQSTRDEKNHLSSVVDNEGFVWEKAAVEEGEFFRVQASIHNHLHVDIFPFYSKNGIMTKNTWFSSHPQDIEFPENYLKPLTTIEFAGIEAPAPNNVKEFLEMKFGKGCVENPEYPNPKLFPFPADVKKILHNDSYGLTVFS